MHGGCSLRHQHLLLLQLACFSAHRCNYRIGIALHTVNRQARSLLVQHLLAVRFQVIFRIGDNQKLLRLHKAAPGVLIGHGYIILAHPTAVIYCLHIVKITIGTGVQHSHRLARVQHSFLQRVKIPVARVIIQALARRQRAHSGTAHRHCVLHAYAFGNSADIALLAQDILIVFAHLVAMQIQVIVKDGIIHNPRFKRITAHRRRIICQVRHTAGSSAHLGVEGSDTLRIQNNRITALVLLRPVRRIHQRRIIGNACRRSTQRQQQSANNSSCI